MGIGEEGDGRGGSDRSEGARQVSFSPFEAPGKSLPATASAIAAALLAGNSGKAVTVGSQKGEGVVVTHVVGKDGSSEDVAAAGLNAGAVAAVGRDEVSVRAGEGRRVAASAATAAAASAASAPAAGSANLDSAAAAASSAAATDNAVSPPSSADVAASSAVSAAALGLSLGLGDLLKGAIAGSTVNAPAADTRHSPSMISGGGLLAWAAPAGTTADRTPTSHSRTVTGAAAGSVATSEPHAGESHGSSDSTADGTVEESDESLRLDEFLMAGNAVNAANGSAHAVASGSEGGGRKGDALEVEVVNDDLFGTSEWGREVAAGEKDVGEEDLVEKDLGEEDLVEKDFLMVKDASQDGDAEKAGATAAAAAAAAGSEVESSASGGSVVSGDKGARLQQIVPPVEES